MREGKRKSGFRGSACLVGSGIFVRGVRVCVCVCISR